MYRLTPSNPNYDELEDLELFEATLAEIRSSAKAPLPCNSYHFLWACELIRESACVEYVQRVCDACNLTFIVPNSSGWHSHFLRTLQTALERHGVKSLTPNTPAAEPAVDRPKKRPDQSKSGSLFA